MKFATLPGDCRRTRIGKCGVAAAIAVLLLAANNLLGGPTATTVQRVAGLGSSGSANGATLTQASFSTPVGLALDNSGGYLYVADRDNNAIRQLDLTYGLTITAITSSINKPVGVAFDSVGNIYVLNRGNGNNGSVLEFANLDNQVFTLVATNAMHLTNATGMALDVFGNIYVTIKSNTVIKITSPGVSNVVATVTNAGAYLQGIVLKRSGPTAGMLAVCDSGRNGVYLIDPASGTITTNSGFHDAGDFSQSPSPSDTATAATAKFNQPMGIAEAGDGSLIVTDNGNHRVKLVRVSNGTVTNLYGVVSSDWAGSYPGFSCHDTTGFSGANYTGNGLVEIPDVAGAVSARLPNGITIGPDGTVYTTEDYYHIIRKVTGAGIAPPLPWPPAAPADPSATAGYGQVSLAWTASAGATNYNIYRSIGGPFNLIASTAATGYTDTNVLDGTFYVYGITASNAGGEGPGSDLAGAISQYSPSPILSVTSTGFGQVSLAWSPSAGATSYNVFRSPSHGGPYTFVGGTNVITSTSYNDTSVVNGTTYYYVVTAVNAGGQNPTNSNEVIVTVPIPPPPAPTIGWFDYEGFPTPVTVFYPISGTPYITHNDLLLAIEPNANGVSTFFTANGANPITTGSTPPPYQNTSPNAQTPLPVLPAPDLIIKAANTNAGGSSAIVTAEFIFQVGTPSIIGNNAAHFAVSDVTLGATLQYTTDGSDPRTNGTVAGIISSTNSSITLSLPFTASTNTMVFQIVGSRANYLTSSVVSLVFSSSNYVPNKISFGFGSGPGSSHLVASPGQAFMAPVALTLNDPSIGVESLQFDLTATNVAGTHPINPAAGFSFYSMLMKPNPQQQSIYIPIPTWSFVTTNAAPPLNDTNLISSTYPYGVTPTTNNVAWYQNMQLTNLSENLLGVGWLELHGKNNLYDTLSQDLITYSLFGYGASGWENLLTKPSVILGGYSFVIPSSATTNDVYQIRITRPSGSGYPNGAVYIQASTNNDAASVGYGSINAIKNVTIGQLKYIVGDVYQAPWYNAGDFGSSNLINEDVQIVFNAAIQTYWLNIPPISTDLYDALDSCGNLGTYDSDPADVNYGYYTNNNQAANINPVSTDGFTPNTDLNFDQLNGLFDGNDTSINQIVFGDGILDVCDIYVTYRRSLDPSLTWYRRFWNNGHRVADTTSNVFVSNAAKQSSGGKIQAAVAATPGSITNTPKVNFTAGDIQATAGQTVHIPVTAAVFGTYPLRVAMLNISVVPLDGSPALASAISFSTGALGSPYTTASSGNNNYAAVWLNSAIVGISNSAIIGTLNITIPATATSQSAYAIHFDHASGSPNGLASLPKHTLTGLITLSSRNTSSYNDGIPDSWRLRWFGTVNNQLSVSNACPSGDGVNNWLKYAAGVDPNTPNDFPGLKPNTPPPSGAHASIYWPTVSGKQYQILSSASLFPGTWTTNATVTGNGGNMLYNDSSAGAAKFYRVQILP